jgi:hypothetical protein
MPRVGPRDSVDPRIVHARAVPERILGRYQWWVLEASPDTAELIKDVRQRALDLLGQSQPVLRRLINAIEEKNCQR